MFQSWRFHLRKAEETLKSGRLDEACEILLAEGLTDFLPGKRLAGRVALALGARAREHGVEGDWKAAWKDFERATLLGGETRDLLQVRRDLTAAGAASVEERLGCGDLQGAAGLLDQFERRPFSQAKLKLLRKVTQQLVAARKLASHGKFTDAERQLADAATSMPELGYTQQQLGVVREKVRESRTLTERLHRHLAAEEWVEAVSVADQLLELAPDSRLAKDARRQAWAHVGAREESDPAMTVHYKPSLHRPPAMAEPEDGDRRLALWVDGVGGYLVCLRDAVVLGQAQDGNRVDVPIMGDLSRKHAVIRRGGEGYWVEPLQEVRINGRIARVKAMLNDGDELELGRGVRVRFRRPHALSASARLEMISPHRTQPSTDGVLLMAESCVLGPNWRNHVVCRDWARDVVLYRHDGNLFCRAMESIEIDGEWCDGRGQLAADSHVAGSDFSMSLEELDRCSTQSLL